MTTASDYSRIYRAIEIFESYGHTVKLERSFYVHGIGVFESAMELFTAATCYDIGHTHGFRDGVKEMESSQEESM